MLFPRGIADFAIDEPEMKSEPEMGSITEPEPDPRVEENGSLKPNPNPNPLTSPPLIFLFSTSSPYPFGVSSSPLTSHTSGLDIFVFAAPLLRLGAGTGVHNPPIPFSTRKFDPGDAATSCLGEEANTGNGMWVGEGENEGEGAQGFPGGAFQSGFGGEGTFGGAEGLRGVSTGLPGGPACGIADGLQGEGDFGVKEGLCSGGMRWHIFGVPEGLRCGADCGVAEGFRCVATEILGLRVGSVR